LWNVDMKEGVISLNFPRIIMLCGLVCMNKRTENVGK
jgi:hypothetical protein